MKFAALQLKPWLYTALKSNNFLEPTEVQEKTFRFINQGKNITVSAPTGSGKTLSYMLPILNNIDEANRNIQYVIIAPTKELVWQTYNNFLMLTKFNKQLKVVLLDNNDKVSNLVRNPSQIVIGTVEKIRQCVQAGVNFKDLKTIVLDEADMLVDFGFVNSINDLFSKLDLFNRKIQKVFCSASIHNNVTSVFNKAVGNIINVQLERNIFTNNKINHAVVYAKNNDHPIDTLKHLIRIINPYLCIIFANTKFDVEKIYSYLLEQGVAVGMLHKDMETRDRKQMFSKLNSGQFKYLVATDLASRGLDIDGVSDVISFGLPKEDIWYLHRSGRTGRGKYYGNSYVIYDKKIENQIHKLDRKVVFKYYLISNDKLVEKKLYIRSNHKPVDLAMKKEIAKLYNKKSLKVKPGYKKKIKQQIFKMQQKAKRQYLDAKFKQIMIEKSKERKR